MAELPSEPAQTPVEIMAAMNAENAALGADNAALRAELAALRAKMNTLKSEPPGHIAMRTELAEYMAESKLFGQHPPTFAGVLCLGYRMKFINCELTFFELAVTIFLLITFVFRSETD